MRTRTGVVVLALVLASCTPALSPSPAPSSTRSTASGVMPSPWAPTPGATQVGAAGFVLMELGNSTSGDRRTDLVGLDLATGNVLLAPWKAADGWAFEGARWSIDGRGLILGQRVRDVGPTILEWSEQWLDPSRAPLPIRFDAEWVFDVAASPPQGAWFSGTAHDQNGPHHTVFRHADGSGTDGQAPVGQLAWSPNQGDAIILTRDGQLVHVEPQTMTTRTLAESVRFLSSSFDEPQVLWSPSGADVLYRADACGLCIQNLESGVVRTLNTSEAGDITELHAWTPLGVVATLGNDGGVILLSPVDGEVGRVLGAMFDVAVSPNLDRLIGLMLEPGGASLTIITVDLATGTEVRYPAPADVLLKHLRWQPAAVDVPWPVWTPPGPDSTPPLTSGSLELDVHGAFVATTSLVADCEVRDGGIAIYASTDEIGTQLGVSEDGAANFLSINGPGFAAFAGKGFDVVPPFVITDPGSTVASGSITFTNVPSIPDGGPAELVSGTLRWSCPAI